MKRKQSGVGIASLIICIIIAFPIILRLVGIYLSRYAISIICWSVPLSLCALLLGITGLFQKERNKLFAILGTILSIPLLGYNGYMTFLLSITGFH